jgi:uridine kinase
MTERVAQIIAICGGSGSGKSTLARKFVGAALLTTDHFYRDIDQLTAREDGTYDFDHPSAVDLMEAADACLALAKGEDITVPVYDYRSGRRTGTQIIAAPRNRLVVIEGVFAFHSPLHEISTLRIFIDTPIDQRMARRIRRDVERGRTIMDTIKRGLEVEEAYERFIQPMRGLADLILMGEEIEGSFAL